MSLAEIQEAVETLAPAERAKLATFAARQDQLAWGAEIDEDFSPDGKHASASEKVDAEIKAGNVKTVP